MVEHGRQIMRRSNDVSQMMKVIGEEGVSLPDYFDYLKGEFFDFVYLQQNAFDPVDEATPLERQQYIFSLIEEILKTKFSSESKDTALNIFQQLRQLFRGLNSAAFKSKEFVAVEKEIMELVSKNKL